MNTRDDTPHRLRGNGLQFDGVLLSKLEQKKVYLYGLMAIYDLKSVMQAQQTCRAATR